MSRAYDCIASVVVYDTSPQVLQECVNSFLDTKLKVKIYIVDNSANKGNYTLPQDERIFYHFNHGRNVGYGKGNNIAIENAEPSKYFLILNPDVFIKDDALEKLIHYMDMNPEIGIGIPKVLNLDGTQQFLNKRYPSLAALFVRRFMPKFLHFLFSSTLENYEMRDLNQNENYEVPFISGAFMLFRRDVLDKVKGFDPRYFLYFEDADICREVQSIGFRTSYYAKANIVHLWKRAAHRDWKITFVFIANMVRYFNKWGWTFF
jgi:hypothetical protein